MSDARTGSATAHKAQLRAILSEKGLPSKLGIRLNPTEQKIHEILCVAYNFTSNRAQLDIPLDVLRKCGADFKKIWAMRLEGTPKAGKQAVLFALTSPAITTTLKTALTKDEGIFTSKIDVVQLHENWAKHLRTRETQTQKIDWSKAERQAQRKNAQITQAIVDGKTFNAQKDNPWARKNLKNRNQ